MTDQEKAVAEFLTQYGEKVATKNLIIGIILGGLAADIGFVIGDAAVDIDWSKIGMKLKRIFRKEKES